jgi:hypothetical protein
MIMVDASEESVQASAKGREGAGQRLLGSVAYGNCWQRGNKSWETSIRCMAFGAVSMNVLYPRHLRSYLIFYIKNLN